jgi:hypothetical protein
MPETCRGCGCTDDNPCDTGFGELCYWAEPGLCSECKYGAGQGPLRSPMQTRIHGRHVA